MITLINSVSNESVNVHGLEIVDGVIMSKKGAKKRAKFIDENRGRIDVTEDADGVQHFALCEGWEIATKSAKRAPRAKKAAKVEEPKKVEPAKVEEPAAVVEPAPTKVEEPTTTTKKAHTKKVAKVEPKTTAQPTVDANEQALLAALRNLKGGAVNVETVREIVREALDEMIKEEPTKVARLVAKAKAKGEVYCANFEDMIKDVSEGYYIYLHGPAGSGKSHTAEQIAARLGLDFYGQTTVQFAHDVRGYGDAGGNFIDTPFFKAFKYGGMYFQDEYDRSNPEAAIVLNSALANGWYDFPVIGRVYAHENFRFIAAGNTVMKGADEEYTTGAVMDASSRDRFATYYEVGYLREVELKIAGGNSELVNFVEDVRKAIAKTGIQHVVSYRATKYMSTRTENKANALARCTFKGLERDEIRMIYGALTNTKNEWAKALSTII